jgi:hypothetical protein
MTESPDALAAEVGRHFGAHAGELGLRADAIEVRRAFSRGGFVNHSFRVSDGRRTLHVKLAAAPEGRAALDRWHRLGESLQRHRAPPVLGRVRIGGTSGLVFPVVPGATPAFSDDVLRAVLDCVRGLWSDRRIASRLPDGTGVTAAECYVDTYHDRFTEDLRAIEAAPPPFLDRRDLEFMRTEAERMRDAVAADPAFDRVLSTPIHGDLWLDNIVWESGASWHIVDWDDLRIGDPAMDVAMLTGPTPRDLTPLKRFEVVEPALGPDLVHRAGLLGRASLLDWVIDPLADWIEADIAGPDRASAVRAEKERIHGNALALYRSMYDGN